MTDDEDDHTAEIYRDKLVDWMMAQDIPTGSETRSEPPRQDFDSLLEVLATYIASLKNHGENQEE